MYFPVIPQCKFNTINFCPESRVKNSRQNGSFNNLVPIAVGGQNCGCSTESKHIVPKKQLPSVKTCASSPLGSGRTNSGKLMAHRLLSNKGWMSNGRIPKFQHASFVLAKELAAENWFRKASTPLQQKIRWYLLSLSPRNGHLSVKMLRLNLDKISFAVCFPEAQAARIPCSNDSRPL